jgi:hypothetical protein
MRWWHHTVASNFSSKCQVFSTDTIFSSPDDVWNFGIKPDVSSFQEFGVEAGLHRQVDKRQDSKLEARGEPVFFIVYPSNQQAFLLWYPGSGPTKIVASNNLVFGTSCPWSSRSPVELLDEANTEIPLSGVPAHSKLRIQRAYNRLCLLNL